MCDLDRVKNQASTEGGSLDAYFEKQKSQAKLDLGWKIYPRHNGSYEVERLMLLNEKSPTSFKWVVDRDGNIKPINGKAMGVTNAMFERYNTVVDEDDAKDVLLKLKKFLERLEQEVPKSGECSHSAPKGEGTKQGLDVIA